VQKTSPHFQQWYCDAMNNLKVHDHSILETYVFFSITLNYSNEIKVHVLHVCLGEIKKKKTDTTRPGVWDIQLFHQTTAVRQR
jgi:hypothetical protein